MFRCAKRHLWITSVELVDNPGGPGDPVTRTILNSQMSYTPGAQ